MEPSTSSFNLQVQQISRTCDISFFLNDVDFDHVIFCSFTLGSRRHKVRSCPNFEDLDEDIPR